MMLHRCIAVKLHICGNFNPVAVLYHGNPELVHNQVLRCMSIAGRNRSMISPGCEIPRDAPQENVIAIYEAIRNGDIIGI